MGFIRCKLNPLKLKDRVGHMFLASGNQSIKHFLVSMSMSETLLFSV